MAAVEQLTRQPSYVAFFQERIVRGLQYWQEHEAIRELQVAILDQDREAILTVIALGLEFHPAWPLVRQLIVALTPYMERRGHWEAWHGILQKAIVAAQRASDVGGETTLTALLARLSQRMSRPADVVTYYRRAIRLARQTGNRFEEARACSNLGYLYIDGGHWWRSEVFSKNALGLFEALRSDHGCAHTHNHLGLLYTRLQQWKLAEFHLRQAHTLWLALGDQHSLIYGFVNLGLYYLEQTSATPALAYLNQAQAYARQTGEMSIMGTILNSMASAYRLQKDVQNAETYAQQAEAIHHQFHNTLGLAQVWNNLGLIHIVKDDRRQVGLFFQNSLRTYRQLGHKVGEIQVLLDMVGFNLLQHDFISATENLRLLTALLAPLKGKMFETYRLRAQAYEHNLSNI